MEHTRILLQNKVSVLENIGGLWKALGEEKIALVLATLINIMSELSDLAKKFELEEELYFGSCLENILSLLGNNHERKFISTGSDSLKFLKAELSQQEKMILFNKNKNAWACYQCAVLLPTRRKTQINLGGISI